MFENKISLWITGNDFAKPMENIILNSYYDWTCSTTEEDIIVDPVDTPDIVDDFELGQEEAVDIDKEVNKQKLKRRISHYKVNS